LRKQVQKLAPQDKEKDEAGSGGGLVLASSKSEVNADTVNTAAVQAVRPVQQQVVRRLDVSGLDLEELELLEGLLLKTMGDVA
jgi:chaperonin GroEL (HSP60 family)